MGNKYKHLSAEERDQIAVMRAEGESFGEIAHTLGRNKSTICREVWRNRSPVYDRYGAIQAQKRAQRRKCEAGRRPLLKNDPTRRYVICKLQQGWSPEQIAGRLPLCWCDPIRSARHVGIRRNTEKATFQTGFPLIVVPRMSRSASSPVTGNRTRLFPDRAKKPSAFVWNVPLASFIWRSWRRKGLPISQRPSTDAWADTHLI